MVDVATESVRELPCVPHNITDTKLGLKLSNSRQFKIFLCFPLNFIIKANRVEYFICWTYTVLF